MTETLDTDQTLAARLARIGPFRDLPPATLAGFAARCTTTRRAAGEPVYDPDGGTPARVFAVVEGEVEVLRDDGRGGLSPVGRIGPGGLAGEFAAIDGRRDGAVLRARSAARLVVIPRDVFRALVERHPAVALHLLRDMIATIRGLNARLATLEGAHAEVERVRGELFRFTL